MIIQPKYENGFKGIYSFWIPKMFFCFQNFNTIDSNHFHVCLRKCDTRLVTSDVTTIVTGKYFDIV